MNESHAFFHHEAMLGGSLRSLDVLSESHLDNATICGKL